MLLVCVCGCDWDFSGLVPRPLFPIPLHNFVTLLVWFPIDIVVAKEAISSDFHKAVRFSSDAATDTNKWQNNWGIMLA